MAVRIRLRRMGAKGAPFYRIVVADSRYPRDGRFIEEIGTYDPKVDPPEIKVEIDKAKSWLSKGAKPTDTVRALLKKSGVLVGPAKKVDSAASKAKKASKSVSDEDVTPKKAAKSVVNTEEKPKSEEKPKKAVKSEGSAEEKAEKSKKEEVAEAEEIAEPAESVEE